MRCELATPAMPAVAGASASLKLAGAAGAGAGGSSGGAGGSTAGGSPVAGASCSPFHCLYSRSTRRLSSLLRLLTSGGPSAKSKLRGCSFQRLYCRMISRRSVPLRPDTSGGPWAKMVSSAMGG